MHGPYPERRRRLGRGGMDARPRLSRHRPAGPDNGRVDLQAIVAAMSDPRPEERVWAALVTDDVVLARLIRAAEHPRGSIMRATRHRAADRIRARRTMR